MPVPRLAPLAVSMGEPAGIGPDLILAMYERRAELMLPPFLVYGSLALLDARARRLGLHLEVRAAIPATAADTFPQTLPIFDIAGVVPDRPGELTQASASVVIEAIAAAVEATLQGECRALVTAPIQKSALYGAGFTYPGHTEFLAALCADGEEAPLPVMMLAHGPLRAVPLTIHVPLAAVPALVTETLISRTVRIVARDLSARFGVGKPRIAVSGLNPHAGEDGSIGKEDAEIIGPALSKLRREGIDVAGPLPADTLFYPPHWQRYDAVIAMYHDQALIPIKTVAFEEAVNITLGLPIVRTSPDHGTALDLAGTGKASLKSFIAAVRLADRMSGGL